MPPLTQPERRPLTNEERVLLEWLMANGSAGAKGYVQQLLHLRVVASCTCGCPSIDLAVGDDEERTVGPSQILVDFDGITAEGVQVVVVLHAREGKLSELEVYAIQKVEGEFGLPTIESLEKARTV